MGLLTLFHFFLIFSQVTSWDKTSVDFVKSYYKDRNINQIVAFACWDYDQAFRFVRGLTKLDTAVNYVPIKDGLEMKEILKVNYYKIGIFLNFSCPLGEIVLEQYSRNNLPFNDSYHWLLVAEENEIPTEVLSRLPLSVETEMTFAQRRQENSYELYDVYNPSYRHGGRLNVNLRGSWNLTEGLKDQMSSYKYVRRGNFNGLSLNVSTTLTKPALPDFKTYLTTPINRHLDTMQRYHYAVVLQLRNIYNFTINLKRAKTWGYFVNGTWNGILAEMINGETDFSAAPFQYLEQRFDVCDFTVETSEVKTRTIFRHSKKNNIRNPFLTPFVSIVWYLIVAFAIICYLTFYLTMKLEENFDERCSEKYVNPQSSSEVNLIVVAAIAQQGTTVVPQTFSSRILFISLFFWGLMLFQFYSASIVGSILAEPPRFMNDLADIVAYDMEFGCEDIVYHHHFFDTSKDPVVLALNEKQVKRTKKKPKGGYTTFEEGISMMKRGDYAFQVDTATAYKIIKDTFDEDEICDLQEVVLVDTKKVSIVTAKKSPFRKMLIYGLRRLVQHGITDALKKIWFEPRPTCPESHSSKPMPVQVQEFSPANFLLFLGCFLSIFIFLLELCYHRFYRESNQDDLSETDVKNSVELIDEFDTQDILT